MFVVLWALGLAPPAGAGTSAQPEIAVPSYISPTADPRAWTELLEAAAGTVGVVVANPVNFPGEGIDPAWISVIDEAHAEGVTVLGYVDTGYLGTTGRATRTGSTSQAAWISQVEADADDWFLNEMSLADNGGQGSAAAERDIPRP